MLKAVLVSPHFDLEGYFFFEANLVRICFLDLPRETEEIGSIEFLSSEIGVSFLNFILM